MERVRAFFTERFGTPEPDFTAYLGPDAASLAATHLRAFGREIEDGFSSRAAGDGKVSIVALDGAASPPHHLDWHYQFHVRSRLAPWGSLPDAPEGYDRRGPVWLWRGVQEYAETAYRASADIEAYEDAHSRHISSASRAARSLGALETQADADAAGSRTAYALGFLAAERLVALAGEPSLFDYYAALPDAADWREAFEAAFGIAPDAFYADFEAYRARVAPPFVLHGLRGVVLDPGGAPLAAAWVGASRGEPSWEHTATTAADGSFALRVRDGRYGLTLDVRDTRCRLAEGHLIRDAADTEVAGADVSGIVIRLPDDASCEAP